jgi:hypothetical protein
LGAYKSIQIVYYCHSPITKLNSNMPLLINECAQILDCPINSLRDRLNHPQNRAKILKAIIGRKVMTTYFDRNGSKKTFIIGGLSRLGADSTRAYGRLPRPFNICVAAHFYARHRIRLHHAYLPCVIEHFTSHGGEDRFYPLELLQLLNVDDEEEQSEEEEDCPKLVKWSSKLFSELSFNHEDVQQRDNEDTDGARCECTQSEDEHSKYPIFLEFD